MDRRELTLRELRVVVAHIESNYPRHSSTLFSVAKAISMVDDKNNVLETYYLQAVVDQLKSLIEYNEGGL